MCVVIRQGSITRYYTSFICEKTIQCFVCNPDQILIAIKPTFNMKNPLTPMQILLRAASSSSVVFFCVLPWVYLLLVQESGETMLLVNGD